MPNTEIQVGDAVTPTTGVWAGDRFRVVAARAGEAMVRADPPRNGKPGAIWVPFAEVRHFYTDEDKLCPVCGSREHLRCLPPVLVPQVGTRVVTTHALVQEPSAIPAGFIGTVVQSAPARVVVEFDAGRLPGLPFSERPMVCLDGKDAERFFDHFEVV